MALSMSMPHVDHFYAGSHYRYVAPSHVLPSSSLDQGDLIHSHHHHHQHQHFPSQPHVATCEPEVQLSLSQDELRRLLDAADYAQRERALLILALEGLSTGEKQSPAARVPEQPQAAGSGAAPVLVRDEGGLFRLVSSERASATPAEIKPVLAPPCLFTPTDDAADDLESDHFRIFRFKVQLCRESRCHDWAQCPFAHPGEKAARRDPRVYRYSAVPCPDVKRSGKCARGDACSMAHGVFECWLHPSRYRTQPCKDGASCRRAVCFFAHSNEQLRLAPAAAAAAAADAVAALGSVKPEEEICRSPTATFALHRRSFEMLPVAMSPDRATSPSSVPSPSVASPPPSPPLRTTSLTRSGFSYKSSPAVDHMHCTPPRFARQQPRAPAPALIGPPGLPPTYSAPGAVHQAPVFVQENSPQLQRDYLPAHSASFSAPSHVQASLKWSQHQAGAVLSSAGFPISPQRSCSCDEEPDLTWVSDLVQ